MPDALRRQRADDDLFLGCDVSTTAAKAIVLDRCGQVVATASEPLRLSQPRPLWSEQDPRDWWAGITASIRRLLTDIRASQVRAIGLTGQMHGLVLLDREGDVIRPAILWNDQRTGGECETIRQKLGKRRLIELTGNDALPGFTAPKILWVRDHEPAASARASHMLLPKDYVRYRLTGDHATDVADASGTLLLDVADRCWSDEILQSLGIKVHLLPQVFEGPEETGRVNNEGARQTGLLEGTPVVAGGGDQSAQAIGVGAISPDKVALTLGTSGVVFAPSEAYRYDRDGRLHAFCHAVPGQWHMMGVMLSAAGALQWYRDSFARGLTYDQLLAEAESTAPGAEGLVFLPYLTGERTPHADPLARGAFVGLTARHNRAHLTRAVLEGVAFGLLDSLELMRHAGVTPSSVRLSGGGSQSALWRQILADVLETNVVTVGSAEGAAYGAALLAAVGAQAFSSVQEACAKTVRETGVTRQSDQAGAYREYYACYRRLYPILAEEFRGLSKLSEEVR